MENKYHTVQQVIDYLEKLDKSKIILFEWEGTKNIISGVDTDELGNYYVCDVTHFVYAPEIKSPPDNHE